MLNVICVNKEYRGNKVVKYTLQDIVDKSNVFNMSADELKFKIRSGHIQVLNLKLTRDNKLMHNKDSNLIHEQLNSVLVTRDIVCMCNNAESLKFKVVSNMTETLNKAKLIGFSVIHNDGRIAVISNHRDYIVVSSLKMKLPIDATKLFSSLNIKELNLSNIDSSQSKSMRGLFEGSTFGKLILHDFNTDNVTDMSYMFCACSAQEYDLSTINTSKVTNMQSMFFANSFTELDLKHFDVSDVKDMSCIFMVAKAQKIDISTWKLGDDVNLSASFFKIKGNNAIIANAYTIKRFEEGK